MGANGFGEVLTTPRAQIQAASAEHICIEVREAEADFTDRALSDDVIQAVEIDERSLLRGQGVRPLAVDSGVSTGTISAPAHSARYGWGVSACQNW